MHKEILEMKKIGKIFTGILAALMVAFTMSATVFAEDEELEDIELSTTRAVQTNGSWGQSITYSESDIKTDRFTEETQFIVEYELEGESTMEYPVELILQNYVADPQIWAQVRPAEFTDTSATFNYEDMVTAYGSDDFSTVNNICVGDRGVKMKVTKCTVTNCKPKPVVTTTTQAETEAVTETEAPAEEVTEAATTAPAEEAASSSGGSMTVIIIVVVAAVVIAGVAVTFIVIKKNRRRFY